MLFKARLLKTGHQISRLSNKYGWFELLSYWRMVTGPRRERIRRTPTPCCSWPCLKTSTLSSGLLWRGSNSGRFSTQTRRTCASAPLSNCPQVCSKLFIQRREKEKWNISFLRHPQYFHEDEQVQRMCAVGKACLRHCWDPERTLHLAGWLVVLDAMESLVVENNKIILPPIQCFLTGFFRRPGQVSRRTFRPHHRHSGTLGPCIAGDKCLWQGTYFNVVFSGMTFRLGLKFCLQNYLLTTFLSKSFCCSVNFLHTLPHKKAWQGQTILSRIFGNCAENYSFKISAQLDEMLLF